MKLHFLVKMVMAVGADEFWKWHGHEPTIAELGDLWIEQKMGDFAFQMFVKVGFYIRTLFDQDYEQIESLVKDYTVDTHQQISVYVSQNSSRRYRIVKLQYGVRADHPAAYIDAACRVLTPYALPYIQEFSWKDLRVALGYKVPEDLELFYIAKNIAPVDIPLFAKQQIAQYMQDSYDDRGMTIIEALVGGGAHQTVLWMDVTEKLRLAKKKTIDQMYEIVQRYQDAHKAPALEYFQYYLNELETDAGRAINMFAEANKELENLIQAPTPFTPDPGVLDLISLLHNSEAAIPEQGTSEAIKALDEFYCALYGV